MCMADSEPTAYIAVYGVDDADIQTAMTEHDIGTMNELIHRRLAETHGLDVDSVGLVTGERSAQLAALDADLRAGD